MKIENCCEVKKQKLEKKESHQASPFPGEALSKKLRTHEILPKKKQGASAR
jgi:hypothetical protein